MRQSFSGVLDIYRFVLAASRADAEDRDSLEIAEQVFLAANSSAFVDIASHFAQFKSFLAAIDGKTSHEGATHIVRFSRSSIVEKFKDAVDHDPAFPLFDFANNKIESRFRLAEIDTYLARSLIASAIDHSAEAVWQFLSELSPGQPPQGSIHIFLNCKEWDGFGETFPLFKVGDLINITAEAKNV